MHDNFRKEKCLERIFIKCPLIYHLFIVFLYFMIKNLILSDLCNFSEKEKSSFNALIWRN